MNSKSAVLFQVESDTKAFIIKDFFVTYSCNQINRTLSVGHLLRHGNTFCKYITRCNGVEKIEITFVTFLLKRVLNYVVCNSCLLLFYR